MAFVNYKSKKTRTFDAIVIGSGISGGWAAKELTQKGLKVLMLERGKDLKHIEGYKTAYMDPWEFKHRGRITNKERETHQFVSRRNEYPYDEHNASYWFKDADSPYKELKGFDWNRSDILGGRSITWGRQSYRLSDLDFQGPKRIDQGETWPVTYDEIAPWYDYVEKFAGISGKKENYASLPDGVFQPPMEMNCVEQEVKKGIEANFKNRIMTIGRTANLTQPIGNRGTCQMRNLCSRGCPFGAYFSTQSSTLPAAMATQKLTVITDSIVSEIIYDRNKKRAIGVQVIDANTFETIKFYSKIIFLNASTVGSAFILLNSKSKVFPNGLGNNEDVVGRYLMDHQSRCGATGEAPGFEDKYYYGRRPNGIYIPRYQNVKKGENLDYIGGFGYQGAASRADWRTSVAEIGIGIGFKKKFSQPGIWRMGLAAYGEILPYRENRVYLNEAKRDKWGLPTMVFDCGVKENENRMRKDMKNDAAEMLEAAGLSNVKTWDIGYTPGQSNHEMGTLRMGSDPKDSVVNKWNQIHDIKNVFITDGGFMRSSAAQNPSLSYMAFTARACDYAVKELKRRNI